MQDPDDTSKALNELLREQNKSTDLESKLQAILNVTGHFLSTATLSDWFPGHWSPRCSEVWTLSFWVPAKVNNLAIPANAQSVNLYFDDSDSRSEISIRDLKVKLLTVHDELAEMSYNPGENTKLNPYFW